MVVARDRELSALRELLALAASGVGRVALVTGGPGTGKTELLRAFAVEVSTTYGVLLTASGSRGERDLPMGVVWQLLHSSPPEVGLLAHVPGLAEDGSPPSLRALSEPDIGTVHGVGTALLELAEARPLVVLVDEVQHIDEVSLQVLLSLRLRMRSGRVLIVLAEWERPNVARARPLAELVRQPHHRIAVALLTPEGVSELIERRLGKTGSAALVTACHNLAGGNPLLTNALLEDVRAGANPMAGEVGVVFRQEVLDCFSRCDTDDDNVDVLAIAMGIAVLNGYSTPEAVSRLLHLPEESVSPVLDVLRAAGLVIGNRLRHAVIAAIVLEGASSGELTRLRMRASELLYRRGADPAEIARHLVAADAVPGAWAVDLLRQASKQSAADDAGFAAACLELALRESAEADRAALRAALVRVAWRVNPAAVGPQVSLLEDALGADDLNWQETAPVVRYLLWQGDIPAAAGRLRRVRASQGEPDDHTAAELRSISEWIYGPTLDRLPEDVRKMLARCSEYHCDGDHASLLPAESTSRAKSVTLRSCGADAKSYAEWVLQGCSGDVLPEAGAMALFALEHTERRDLAWFWSDELCKEIGHERDATWHALLGCVRAELAFRRGDLAAATTRAAAALEMLHPQAWGVLIGLPLATRVLSMTAMGRLGEAAELLDRAVPDAMFDTVFGARYLYASGCHSLASGRSLAAIDDFERCGVVMATSGLDLPAAVPWRTDLAQAYLATGDRERARQLAQEQLGRPMREVGDRARGSALRVLAAADDGPRRVMALREAIQLFARCGDRLGLARALTDLSKVKRELSELDEARKLLRRAEQELETCQAAQLASSDDRSVDGSRIGTRPHGQLQPSGHATGAGSPQAIGLAALSEAERNVADLAARGHTNREIGRMRYITVSTVEQHLTQVYRKLHVTRRSELPAMLATDCQLHGGDLHASER